VRARTVSAEAPAVAREALAHATVI